MLKKSSCIVYYCVCYHCIGMYPVYICIFLHESADDNTTICLHIKWFQVMLTLIIQFRLICFAVKLSNSSIWAINGSLTGTTTLDQSGSGCNGNERLFPIPQRFRAKASPSYGLVSYQDTHEEWALSLCRDAVGIFFSSSQLSWQRG